MHYYRVKRGGTPELSVRQRAALRKCTQADCGKAHKSKGLCETHYMASMRANDPELRAKEVQRTADWKKRNKEQHAAQQSRYKTKYSANLKSYLAQWKKDNKESYNAYLASRKHRVKQATPPWANLDEIREFYRNRPLGYHVDHIEPINGKDRSGLHVIWNLQYLLASENLKKSNKTS